MPDNRPAWMTVDAIKRTEACVLDFENDGGNVPGPKPRVNQPRPPIRGILLQDLVHEGQADCAVTQKVSSPAIQEILILGTVGGGTFTISFKGKTTDPIACKATAAVLQAALEKLETIGPGNVIATLGDLPAIAATLEPPTTGKPEEFPGLWLVQFVGVFLTRDPSTIPLMTANSSISGPAVMINEKSVFVDTGVIETVNAVSPVETPTPMRAGAVVICIPFPGIGYGVINCEPRQFIVIY